MTNTNTHVLSNPQGMLDLSPSTVSAETAFSIHNFHQFTLVNLCVQETGVFR